MNSDMVKPEKPGHLHLVYHFTVSFMGSFYGLLDLSGPRPPVLLSGPHPSAPGPHIPVTLKQVA